MRTRAASVGVRRATVVGVVVGGHGGLVDTRHVRELWRFVNVQHDVGELAKTAIDSPPMQKPATFNLDAIKAKIQETLAQQQGQ